MARSGPRVDVAIAAVDKFTAPFRAIERSIKGFGKSTGLTAVGGQLRSVGAAGKELGTRLRSVLRPAFWATSAGVGGAALALKSFTDEASRIVDVSSRLGIAPEALQKLEYAAKLSGAELDEFQGGFRKFVKTVGDAARGGKSQAQAFRKIGISLKDQKGNLKSSDVLFGELADRIASIRDPQRQLSVATQFFGKQAASLLPVLKQGSAEIHAQGDELARLGMITNDQAKAGEAFGDSLEKVGTATAGLRNAIGVALLPVVSDLSARFLEWWSVTENKEKVLTTVADAAKLLGTAVAGLAGWLLEVTPGFLAWAQSMGGAESALKGFAAVVGLAAAGKVWKLGKALAGLTGSFYGVGKAIATWALPAFKFLGRGLLGLVGILARVTMLLLANPWAIALGAAIAAVVLIYRNWEPIKGFFSDLWGDVTEAFNGAVDRIRVGWTGLTGWLTAKADVIRNLVPEWITGSREAASSASGHGAAPSAPRSGTAPVALAPVPLAGGSAADVSGTLAITLNTETGRARVTKMKTEDPGFQLTFDAGPIMTPAYGG